jgi:hypothetical protein
MAEHVLRFVKGRESIPSCSPGGMRRRSFCRLARLFPTVCILSRLGEEARLREVQVARGMSSLVFENEHGTMAVFSKAPCGSRSFVHHRTVIVATWISLRGHDSVEKCQNANLQVPSMISRSGWGVRLRCRSLAIVAQRHKGDDTS